MRWIAVPIVLTAAVVLYLYPPGPGTLYPLCPIHMVTGFRCPGCGSTHALHALLHGRVAEAVRYNALIVCSLPFAVASYIAHLVGDFHTR